MMTPAQWEMHERMRLGRPKPVTDDLTTVIGVLDRMLTEYHETRPARPLKRHY